MHECTKWTCLKRRIPANWLRELGRNGGFTMQICFLRDAGHPDTLQCASKFTLHVKLTVRMLWCECTISVNLALPNQHSCGESTPLSNIVSLNTRLIL